METKTNPHPLMDFMELLVKRDILPYPEAEVYVILVDMGKATASEIHLRLIEKTSLKKTTKPTVHNILEKLHQKGFIKHTIASGKRKHSKHYKANSPEDALKPYFEDTKTLKDLTSEVVAKLEINEQNEENKVEQDIWLYEPKRVAVREGIKHLQEANDTIVICCNNYTWIQAPGIEEVLLKKIKAKVKVRILGEKPSGILKSSLDKFNDVRRESEIPCNPYCLIDGQQLLIFFCEGLEHRLMATKNTYLVEHYSAQFEKIWKKFSNEV